MKIQLYDRGLPQGQKLFADLQTVCQRLQVDYDPEYIKDLSKIISRGIQGSTVLLVDNEVVFIDQYPGLKELENIIGAPVEYWAYPNGVYDHKGAVELSKYFKLSFTLISKRDSVQPLQTIRRMIVPECSPQGLLKSMHRTFSKQ